MGMGRELEVYSWKLYGVEVECVGKNERGRMKEFLLKKVLHTALCYFMQFMFLYCLRFVLRISQSCTNKQPLLLRCWSSWSDEKWALYASANCLPCSVTWLVVVGCWSEILDSQCFWSLCKAVDMTQKNRFWENGLILESLRLPWHLGM